MEKEGGKMACRVSTEYEKDQSAKNGQNENRQDHELPEWIEVAHKRFDEWTE